MSWPSFYGYKYTPIGLRQRDIVEESGKRTVSTTVHLPEGGHLFDIERAYAPDGSIAKKETSCFAPSAIEAPPAPLHREPSLHRALPAPAPSHAPLAIMPAPSHAHPDPYEPRGISDLERQADDIIANFRARHATGLDRVMGTVW